MRQVFSSPRSENVEAVARMLEAEGIEVRIENGRSFRSSIRGNFSYREGADTGPNPAVWVVRSDDQPRARQLLRDAGLLNTPTTIPNAFLSPTPHAASAYSVQRAQRRTTRFRIGLVAAIAIIALALVFKPRPSEDARPATNAAALSPGLAAVATATDATYLIATPPALAATLARHEQARDPALAVCLGIDGDDAPDTTLSELRAEGIDAHPASGCTPDGALRVNVYAWRTDGSGSGTVTWSVAEGAAQAEVRSREARREGDDWRLLDDAP